MLLPHSEIVPGMFIRFDSMSINETYCVESFTGLCIGWRKIFQGKAQHLLSILAEDELHTLYVYEEDRFYLLSEVAP